MYILEHMKRQFDLFLLFNSLRRYDILGGAQERVSTDPKGYVTRNDSQLRFLAQHSLATLLRHCFIW